MKIYILRKDCNFLFCTYNAYHTCKMTLSQSIYILVVRSEVCTGSWSTLIKSGSKFTWRQSRNSFRKSRNSFTIRSSFDRHLLIPLPLKLWITSIHILTCLLYIIVVRMHQLCSGCTRLESRIRCLQLLQLYSGWTHLVLRLQCLQLHQLCSGCTHLESRLRCLQLHQLCSGCTHLESRLRCLQLHQLCSAHLESRLRCLQLHRRAVAVLTSSQGWDACNSISYAVAVLASSQGWNACNSISCAVAVLVSSRGRDACNSSQGAERSHLRQYLPRHRHLANPWLE